MKQRTKKKTDENENKRTKTTLTREQAFDEYCHMKLKQIMGYINNVLSHTLTTDRDLQI